MNGVIGEVEVNAQEAADHRHGPFVSRVQFPDEHPAIQVGEALFYDENGKAVPAGSAGKETTATANGTDTTFTFSLGEILPGSVLITTDDTTAKAVSDNGDGTLGGEDEDGTGTVDYATGKVTVTFSAAPAQTKTVTVEAVKGGDFIGIANNSVGEDEDNGVNVVVHGSIHEGLAKFDGEPASFEQYKFLRTHGIY